MSSWSDLPPELWGKIFKNIPRFWRYKVGLVCRYWREVVHNQALQYLSTSVKKQLIDEKQLERWGCCSLKDPHHNSILCGCIDIFSMMSPFARKTPTRGKAVDDNISFLPSSIFGITSSKVFYAKDDINNPLVSVIDRSNPDNPPRNLKTPGSRRSEGRKVRICSCNDLVVISERRFNDHNMPEHQISLWDGVAETCIEVLELVDKFPPEEHQVDIRSMAISREILAVQFVTVKEVEVVGWGVVLDEPTSTLFTLLWRVNTAQPATQPAHFIILVRHPENPSGVLDTGNIAMNDKYFVRGRIDLSKTRDLTIRVYREERTRIDLVVSELETLLSTEDTKFAEGWRVPLGRRLSYVKARELLDRMKLEPGHSNRLAVYAKGDNNLRIIDLVTSNPISIITTKNWIVGSNWCCGCLLIFKSLNDQVATGTYKISIVDPGAVEKTGEKSVPAAISGFTTLGYFDCPLQWRSLPQIHMDLTGIVLNHASTDLNCYLFKSPT